MFGIGSGWAARVARAAVTAARNHLGDKHRDAGGLPIPLRPTAGAGYGADRYCCDANLEAIGANGLCTDIAQLARMIRFGYPVELRLSSRTFPLLHRAQK